MDTKDQTNQDSSTLFSSFTELSDIDKSIDPGEFASLILTAIVPILEKEFPNCAPKQQPRRHVDRISIACPYCGDSTKNLYAKRGNFILGGKHRGMYKCHNCGEYKSIDRVFTDYGASLRLDAINYLSEIMKNREFVGNVKYDMSTMLDMGSIETFAIDREEFKASLGYVEAKESTVISWLNNRLQFSYENYLFDPMENKLIILNLTREGNILGIQKRFMVQKRFETYKLSKLYEMMGRVVNPEDDWNYLDTISMLFNICNLNFARPVVVFEGPMDSFLYHNSIAITGANKGLPVDIPVKYMFDYDKTGVKESINHLGRGESVFLWSKFIQDYSMPYREKWDWNDVIIYFRNNGIKIPNVNKYFSDDPMDIIDI